MTAIPFDRTELEQGIVARFAKVAAQHASQTAICGNGEECTYEELERRTNQVARAIIDRLCAGTTAFVDDLPVHHASVAKHAPDVWRLHMVAEPRLAPAVPPAPHAHARIDDWPTASDWLIDRLTGKA